MTSDNPYQAYTEGSVFSDQPLRLVVALYESALEATRQASGCLEARDIWGRGKAINKGIAILSELLVSLDDKRGGDMARNLKRLYLYMQRRLIEAHSRQTAAPLGEVEKLLETMLEGWREAAANGDAQDLGGRATQGQNLTHLAFAVARPSSFPTEAQPYAEYLGHDDFEQDLKQPASPAFSF